MDSSSRVVIDAAIQRFEFTYEAGWKALKAALELEGILAESPRATFKKAYRNRWINHEEEWIRMLDDRNLTSYLYNKSVGKAEEQALVGRISNPPSGYFPAFMRRGLTAQACPLRAEIRPTACG